MLFGGSGLVVLVLILVLLFGGSGVVVMVIVIVLVALW